MLAKRICWLSMCCCMHQFSLYNHTTFYVVINVCLPVSAERIDALAVRRIVGYCSITTATPTD